VDNSGGDEVSLMVTVDLAGFPVWNAVNRLVDERRLGLSGSRSSSRTSGWCGPGWNRSRSSP